MKIAIINQPQDPVFAAAEQRGSVAIVNFELARRLAGRHAVTLYAPMLKAQPARERHAGLTLRRIPGVKLRFHQAVQILTGRLGLKHPYAHSALYYREYYQQLARALALDPPDVIHLPQQLQFASLLKRAAPSAQLVLHMHQDELAQLDASPLQRWLARIDQIVTVSDFVSTRARRRFPHLAARIHTIGNGVDLQRFRPETAPRAPAKPTRLLFVGRISPDKGLHLLFEAFAELAAEHPELTLTLVGKPGMLPFGLVKLLLQEDPALAALHPFYGAASIGWLTKELVGQHRGYLKHLGELIPTPLKARVCIRGRVSLEELATLYARADLLVLPSIWQESYGLPVAEAMASGTPVLASRCGGMPELVQDGVTGRLVPRLDGRALAAGLRELLADPAALRRMGQAARAHAERHLSWEDSAARLEEVYSGHNTAGVPVSVGYHRSAMGRACS